VCGLAPWECQWCVTLSQGSAVVWSSLKGVLVYGDGPVAVSAVCGLVPKECCCVV
jgi:hypothetical protein